MKENIPIMGKPEDFREDSVFPSDFESCGGGGARGSHPQVIIDHCIGFQKFRYSGENRPGMKHQDKDFLHLTLHNMSGRQVTIQILCFDAQRTGELHPNGLVGRDCHHGVYTKYYPISKRIQVIKIPYLRTERMKTRKAKTATNRRGSKDSNSSTPPTISYVLEQRAKMLPSPYRERGLQQCTVKQEYDTTRVCLGVIATMDQCSEPLFCLSNVIQNASEKTQLKVLKLSKTYVSAQDGGEVDIFTTDDGPPITEEKCIVRVTVEGQWTSPDFMPTKDQILYKRVVTYPMPAYAPDPGTTVSVSATLHLFCTQSGQTSSLPFIYEPGPGKGKELGGQFLREGTRKRTHSPNLEGILSNNVRLRVRETVKCSQARATTTAITSPPSSQQQCVTEGLTLLAEREASHLFTTTIPVTLGEANPSHPSSTTTFPMMTEFSSSTSTPTTTVTLAAAVAPGGSSSHCQQIASATKPPPSKKPRVQLPATANNIKLEETDAATILREIVVSDQPLDTVTGTETVLAPERTESQVEERSPQLQTISSEDLYQLLGSGGVTTVREGMSNLPSLSLPSCFSLSTLGEAGTFDSSGVLSSAKVLEMIAPFVLQG